LTNEGILPKDGLKTTENVPTLSQRITLSRTATYALKQADGVSRKRARLSSPAPEDLGEEIKPRLGEARLAGRT
jgi:hypothetical protein